MNFIEDEGMPHSPTTYESEFDQAAFEDEYHRATQDDGGTVAAITDNEHLLYEMDMAECFDPPCNKIRIPMSINGNPILAVYDTGSDYAMSYSQME